MWRRLYRRPASGTCLAPNGLAQVPFYCCFQVDFCFDVVGPIRKFPMTISMYQASVPVFVRMLGTLSKLLDKAQAHAEAKKFDVASLISFRLYPDMLPFSKQVQIACDAAKLCCVRISGVEAPKFEDNETTIAELKERIAKTIAYLESVPRDALDGSEEKPVIVKVAGNEINFRAQDYLLNFATPNMYFHITTAYAILRHNGVEVGKGNYLGLV